MKNRGTLSGHENLLSAHYYEYQTVKDKKQYTVFIRIHAPARTPKYPEGCVYLGLISSKSNDVRRLWGFPKVPISFLMRENPAFMRTQLTEIKWRLLDL